MFLPNPGIMAAGVQGRTYDEFVAHVTALAENGSILWTSEINITGAAPLTRKYLTTASGTFTGFLRGSPAGSRASVTAGSSSTVARMIQHSLPDGDLSGAAAGQAVYFEIERLLPGNPALTGKTINGFTSTSAADGLYGSGVVSRVIWWSGGRAWQRDPFSQTPATPYDW